MNRATRSSALLAATSVLALAAFDPASAQDAPGGGGQGTELGEVVVTARKTAESAQDVPIAISTVSGDQLQKLTVRDVIEVQKMAPGLYINSIASSYRPKIAIRGQAEADSRLTTDSSVGFYMDGVAIPRTYGLRSVFVDLAQVEVLKGPQGTLFGKNTTGGALNITTQHPTYELGGYVDALYGSYNNRQLLAVANVPIVEDKFAIRAVFQRIKRDGYGESLLGQELGNDNVWNARLHLRFDPTDNINLLVSADWTQVDGVGSNNPISTDRMLAGGNASTRALGEIAAELGLNPNSAADRLTAYNAWLPYYQAYAAGERYDGFADIPLLDEIRNGGVSANLGIDLGPVQFRSISAFRRIFAHKIQDLDGTPFDLQYNEVFTRDRVYSQEFQLSAIDGDGFDWQVGLYYSNEQGNDLFYSEGNPRVNQTLITSVTDVDVKNTSKAAYAQGVYHLADTVRVTGGVRYTEDTRSINSHNRVDPSVSTVPPPAGTPGRCNLLVPAAGGPVYPLCAHPASTTFDAWTWLASADWRPTDQMMYYVSVSKGFRAGGYTEQANSAPLANQNAVDAAFTPFNPETVVNYEIGAKTQWFNRRLRINAAAYYQDYQDIQVQIRDIVNGLGITLLRNAAAAKIKGGELEVAALPIDNLEVTAGAAYTRARYDEFRARDTAGNLLDLSAQRFAYPEWTFNIGGTYTVPLSDGSLRFNANWAWVDDVQLRPDTPTIADATQKAYGLLDARITWTIASMGLDLSVWGKNLTDEEYITGFTNLEGQGWNLNFPGDPRTVGIQVRKTFGQ